MRNFLVVVVATFLTLPTAMTAANEGGPSPEDVAFVQGLLVRFGYDPGPIDGICGDLTANAVRAFHEDRDLHLEPGDVEPQAATVAHNLMTSLTETVMSPETKAPKIYEDALAGDPDAAMAVGEMYLRGDNVTADEMLAYAWWSVAETYGHPEAATMKDDLMKAGQISGHEQQFATSLAETICSAPGHKALTRPSPDVTQKRYDATM